MTRMLPTQKYVSELVEEFMDGSLAIPEIQRDVVWKPDQVKEQACNAEARSQSRAASYVLCPSRLVSC